MKYFLFFIPFFFLYSCSEEKPTNAKPANIDSLLTLYPDSVPLLILHGTKMMEQFQYDKALEDGAKAFRLDSSKIESRMLYAQVLNNRPNRSIKDVLSAQRHFTCIIKKEPKNTKAIVSLATTYSQQLDFETSFKYINLALKINPKYRDAYVLKGTNYRFLNKIDLAKSSYQTAVEQDPKFYEAYLMLGSLYEAEGNPLCLEYYLTARKLQPKNVDVLYALAYAKQNFGKLEEAKQIYRKMIRLDTTYTAALFQQGFIFHKLQVPKSEKEYNVNMDSAYYFYNSTVTSTPKYVQAWHNLACYYLERHKVTTDLDRTFAFSALAKALEISPDFKLSKNMADSLARLK